MLPYRPRKVAVKRRTKTTANIADDPVSTSATTSVNGVAVPPTFPQALRTDLLTMRADFLRELELIQSFDIGESFGVCKTIFRERRVAAWHSRFLPPRCDSNAWGQLIYAACLGILPLQPHSESKCKVTDEATTSPPMHNSTAPPDSTAANVTTDDDKHSPQHKRRTLSEAAFAVFALYILHETNPLPRGDKVKGFQLLPMGIRNREKPHLLYRRSFRPWIRVDPSIFASLLYWREAARAQSASPSTCSLTRCIADDVLAVLENLWDQFDFVSYTGPRGLEAMANHPDYPYKSAPPDVSNILLEETELAEHLNKLNQSTNGDENSSESMETLQKMAQDYLEACRSIRIPPPVDDRRRRRLDRLRMAIAPLYNDTPGMNVEGLLSQLHDTQSATTVLQSRPRMVTFSIHESVISSRRDDPTSAGRSQNGEEQNEGHESYELVLPLGTSASMRRSLEDAVGSLLERDSMALMGSLLPAVSVPANGAHHHDGISTLAPPSLGATRQSDEDHLDNTAEDASAATSIRSSAGRDALVQLLEQTKKHAARSRKRGRPSTTGAASPATSVQSSAGQEALRALLEMVEPETPRPKGAAAAAAASSTASVQSNAGYEALRALLERATTEGATVAQEQSEASTSAASIQSSAGREALRALLEQVNAETPVSKRPRRSSTRKSGASVQSDAGREALRALLERINTAGSKNGDDTRAGTSVASAQSGIGRHAIDMLLQQVKDASKYSQSADTHLGTKRKAQSTAMAAASPEPPHAKWGTSFLDQSDWGDPSEMARADDLSDFSADEQDDFSVAVSSMGRRAMQELLDSVETQNPGANTSKKKSSTVKSPKKQKKLEGSPVPARERAATPGETRKSKGKRGNDNGTSNDERSTAGNDALKNLLSKVARK